MDHKTANILNKYTSDFYARYAGSFSSTRNAPWNGWQRCLGIIDSCFPSRVPLSVLDLGCGNLRFEELLLSSLDNPLELYAIDNCPALQKDGIDVDFQELDIVDDLLSADRFHDLIHAPDCDIVCAFGLMHHVPCGELREKLLDSMVDKTRPSGLMMIALWQFEKDARIFSKAQITTERFIDEHPGLTLDAHDHVLGWQDEQDAFRYCHSFCETEIEDLIDRISGRAALIDRFEADGKSDDLNCYLVFRRC